MKFLQKLFNKQTPVQITLTITSPNGFHLRPIAKFVNEIKKFETSVSIEAKGQTVTATQVPKILSLTLEKGESFTLITQGKNAHETSEYLSSYFVRLMNDDKEVKEVIQDKETSIYQGEHKVLQGITIAKGIAIGVPVSYFTEKIYQETGSILSLKEALSKTSDDLNELYEKHREKEESEIFLAHKALLQSDLFQNNFASIEEEISKLKGGKFESRIADYKDIKKRIESYMGMKSTFTLPDGNNTPCIVLVDGDLLPSEVEELSKLNVVGVILQSGSTTSHASILLRSFNIPSIICKCEEVLSIPGEYFYSILDASAGQFIDVPTEEDYVKAKERLQLHKQKEEVNYLKRLDTVQTLNGSAIKVLANITDLSSAKEAKEFGADGIGLLRTEFMFTKEKPSIAKQTETYKEIFKLFNEVTIRTLDIGGDKSLPYINIAKEDNPFLGIRGIRFSLKEQTLFKEQLLAVGLASADVQNTKIKIMFPMVGTIQEFIEAKNIALEVYKQNNIAISNIQFGIMLEVPSVIFALKEFDNLVDFYSIGSNDLTQYLFAIERTHQTLSVDVTSPALLSALKQIIETTKKPISICGELAGLEVASKQLISMGYQTLSVSAKLIPSLKERIRNV